MDFGELLMALDLRYEAGDWFGIPDTDTGWSTKSLYRPYVLLDAHQGPTPAKVYPRTSTGSGQIAHAAHPRPETCTDVARRCQIDRAGNIVTTQISISGKLLRGRYRCSEPDAEIVRLLQSARFS